MKKKNRTIKQVLKILVDEGYISKGEYLRIWSDYKCKNEVDLR